MSFSHTPGVLWTPVRTKPRREKKVAEYCAANNISCYLPLLKKVHRYGGRTVEFFIPMFAGYIFCGLDDEKYQRLTRSNSILFRINMDKFQEEALVGELNAIKVFEELSKHAEVIVKPELAEGSKVVINSGPLRGALGIIERRKGKTLVSVNIEMLGQSVTAEFDAGDLESA
jgi:transcription antitermination factor NusG